MSSNSNSTSLLPEGSKVAIVGCGTSGILAIRWCIERGYKPTGFERSNQLGGIWRHAAPPAHSPAYDSLYTNSSVYLMNISDYPFPFKTKTPFPRHDEICTYYEGYVKAKGLDGYIQWNTDVIKVSKNKEGKGWVVITAKVAKGGGVPGGKRNDDESTWTTHHFDAVLVATGKHWDPSMPMWSVPSKLNSTVTKSEMKFADTYNGRITHSHDYRNPSLFKNKSVVCVGIGNSALDISLELSQDPNVKKPIYVAIRGGTVILPVRDSSGNPNDVRLGTRMFQYVLPSAFRKLYFASLVNSTNVEFKKYGLPPPKDGPASPTSQVSNLKQDVEYLEALRKGLIVFVGEVKGDILPKKNEKGENKIITLGKLGSKTNETMNLDIDEIVCCTGYRMHVDYLDKEIKDDILVNIDVDGRNLEMLRLYKHICYAKDPTLGFISFITSLGNESVMGELQARWLTAMWKGLINKPTQEELDNYVKRQEDKIRRLKPYVTTFVPYVAYMDELGKDLKSIPPLWDLAKSPSNWYLVWKLLTAPLVPSQYLLQGVDRWDGARDFISRL